MNLIFIFAAPKKLDIFIQPVPLWAIMTKLTISSLSLNKKALPYLWLEKYKLLKWSKS